jgi:putative ABC transport system permease protein
MNWTDNFKAALFNILGAKLRSFLAVLGILIGTSSVVALVMSGQLATQHALAQFKVLGTNLLAINVYQQNQQKNASSGEKLSYLTLQQALNSGQADKNIQLAAPYTEDYTTAYFDDQNLNASVIGASDALAQVIKIQLQKGRFVSLLDRSQHYAVVGNKVAATMRKEGAKDILDRQIVVGKNVFTIIGIAKAWPQNNFFGQDINSSIIIPIQAALTLSKYAQVQNIVYRIAQNVNVESIKNNLHQYINRYISDGQVFVRSPQQIIASMNKQQTTFTVLLGVIGGISLLVGGIGVMNIMIVSVVERKREIGIRRAVGARQSNIRNLFLAESITLSLFGGIVGVIVGILASFIIAKFFDWEFHFFALPAVIGFAVSVFVGIFFGFYPAVKASKLDPILLLRSE